MLKNIYEGGKIVLHLFSGIQLGKKLIFWDQSQIDWDQLDPSQDRTIPNPDQTPLWICLICQ